MNKITDQEIKKGLDAAYKKAGHNAYFGNGFEAGVKFAESVKKNDLSHIVSNPLPVLVTEEYPNEWIASLKGIRGMIATGETEEEAISALMTSVKVMLLYNRL